MKLVIAIVQDEDSGILIDELMQEDFRVTKLASTGGFLKSGNTTLLLGLDDERVEQCLEIINKYSKKRKVTSTLMNLSMQGDGYMPYPLEVTVGGANIFILNVEDHLVY